VCVERALGGYRVLAAILLPITFLIAQATTLLKMSGNEANQVVDLTFEEPIEISDDEQG